MKILALDTSGEVCSLAVTEATAENSTPLAEYNFAHQRHLTERLPIILNNLLTDVGYALDDIELFAVGVGPGSFTGVRVGVTFAKLWAEVYQKPLVAISSLDILAWQYNKYTSKESNKNSNAGVAAITLARRGELIVAFYTPGERESVVKPHLVATEKLVSTLKTYCETYYGAACPLVVLVESVALLETLRPYLTSEDSCYLYADTLRAATVAELAWHKIQFSSGDAYEDPATLVPLYVAPTPVG
jgi:tRNA threonylcarbamoyladenosine biosynthesis protein TsaB